METTIYKVSAMLTGEGWRYSHRAIPVKETAASFTAEGLRVSKNKLMIPDTKTLDSHRYFRFYTYCREGEVEDAKQMLTEHILMKAAQVKSEWEAVAKHLPQP